MPYEWNQEFNNFAIENHVNETISALNLTPYFNFSVSEAYNIMLSHSYSARRIFGTTTEVLLIVLYIIITSLGVVNNLGVCCVVSRRSQRKISRNLYVFNLALSDLLLSIVCTPVTLVVILNRTWNLGTFICRLLPVVQGANILVSTATITIIAIDRYCTIVSFSDCSRNMESRRRRAILVCFGVWIVAVTFTFPLAFFQAVEEVTIHRVVLWRTCMEKWPNPRLRGVYTLGVMLIQYVIPTVVLTLTHVQITRHLHVRNNCISAQKAKRELERNRRATVTLMTIAAVFATSWLPLHVFSLLADFGATRMGVVNLYTVFAFCHSFAMTSACSNPVLYGWLNSNFRREALKMVNHTCLSSSSTLDDGEERLGKQLRERQTPLKGNKSTLKQLPSLDYTMKKRNSV